MTVGSTSPDVRVDLIRKPKTGKCSEDNLLACVWVVKPKHSYAHIWIAPVERLQLHAHLLERIHGANPTAETQQLFIGRYHSEKFEVTESWITPGTVLDIIQRGFARVIDEPNYADILKARIRIFGHCAMPGTVRSVAQRPPSSGLVIDFQNSTPHFPSASQAI